jgi:hypothetical protein
MIEPLPFSSASRRVYPGGIRFDHRGETKRRLTRVNRSPVQAGPIAGIEDDGH